MKSNPTARVRRDRFYKARGGTAAIWDLSCASCGEFLLRYQKDGVGQLLRLYVDRITGNVPPEQAVASLTEMSALTCSACGALIGTPVVYRKEGRL